MKARRFCGALLLMATLTLGGSLLELGRAPSVLAQSSGCGSGDGRVCAVEQQCRIYFGWPWLVCWEVTYRYPSNTSGTPDDGDDNGASETPIEKDP